MATLRAKTPLASVIFVIIAGIGVLAAVMMMTALRWTLDDGFDAYLARTDAEQFDALIIELQRELSTAPEAASKSVGPETFADYFQRAVGEPLRRAQRPPPGPFGGPPGGGGAGPRPMRPPERFAQRLLALGPDEQQLAGPRLPPSASIQNGVRRADIEIEGQHIGSVLLVPRGPSPQGLESAFLKSQYTSGTIIIAVVVLVSLIPALYLARKASNLVEGIGMATRGIAARDFECRAPPSNIREIDKVTSDINTLSDHLQQLETSRRRWLAELSHELRTPLTILQGEVQAIIDGIRPNSIEAISSLDEEILRLGQLIDDLHFVAVSEISEPAHTPALVCLVEKCGEAIKRFDTASQRAGLRLRLESQLTEPSLAFIDTLKVDRVLDNLLTNSLRYTDAPGEILITIAENDEEFSIHVDDTPPHVPKRDLAALFDPLFRVDATRDRAVGGSGLGLSVAATIMSQHGGTISATASPMGGLRITLNFPKKIEVT